MSLYHTCPICGANLDPGEACDCIINYKEEVKHENDAKKNNHPEFQRV
jgi:hypothetical protein